jgi:hypothetical protein
MTLRALLESPAAASLEWSGLTDAIKVLVGRGDLQPALPAENEAERATSTSGLNAAVMAQATESGDLGYLASPVTGGGVRVDQLTQLYLQAKKASCEDPAGVLAAIAARGAVVGRDSIKLGPDETLAAITKQVGRIEQRIMPLLERLGIE